jgi:hypothetical protein
MIETMCDEELEEVLAAIERVHLRYCAACPKCAGERSAMLGIDP